jgi:hypothetical protein
MRVQQPIHTLGGAHALVYNLYPHTLSRDSFLHHTQPPDLQNSTNRTNNQQ